jgi:restriction system protein
LLHGPYFRRGAWVVAGGSALERSGYEVELQRGTKDGGVDLFAIKYTGVFGRERYLLQAKRWKNTVGIEPVRQLAFLHHDLRMTKSCLATTSTFTKGAWALAEQYEWQLELRDFEGLQPWVGGLQNKIII